MSIVSIRLRDLSKAYHLRRKQHRGFLSGRLFGSLNSAHKRDSDDRIWALRNLSFELTQGESLGFVGPNGAGKSTLLKILARITKPTSGSGFIRGRVGSLLEVGSGFHPELTGRENIFLNGSILGMTRREIKAKLEQIVDFSGVEHQLEMPVKFYSTGQYTRLGFAVAAHLESEILIVDEVLSVGDAQFQTKCMDKMHSLMTDGRTILFVSHASDMVVQICTRAIWLNQGQMVDMDDPQIIVSKYKQWVEAESGIAVGV
jgi:lipopolysaccharide transport system ATP-binding protein